MKPIRLALAAATLAALPAVAHAYDNKPTKPPHGGGNPVSVPAPAALGLFAVGIAGLAVARVVVAADPLQPAPGVALPARALTSPPPARSQRA